MTMRRSSKPKQATSIVYIVVSMKTPHPRSAMVCTLKECRCLLYIDDFLCIDASVN